MGRRILQHTVLVVFAAAVAVLLAETFCRWFVRPSSSSFGTLAGVELPPLRLLTSATVHEIQNPKAPFDGMVVDGKQISIGDLWGHYRLDPVIGYAYQENVTSTNGWWQSNNLGSRARRPASRAVATGHTRVLIFGESCAHGSRLPQEQAWPTVIGESHPDLDVQNLAVDGYSMAQALLRYRQVREQMNYNVAVLMFVPEADLWRDINTLRQLVYPSWDSPLMPRFVLSDRTLALVPVLYPDPFDLYVKNSDAPSSDLRQYLRHFDRFYFPPMYEESHGVEKLILWKLLVRTWWIERHQELRAGLMDPDGEALQVSRAVFDAMQEQVRADGAAFTLVILPFEHRWWDGTARDADAEVWRNMVSFVCARQTSCVDLLPKLAKAAPEEVDRVYDGEHFGPKMNLRIATA